jgi:ectoine hydroxylase-related dioxygenase (phytanoyl-CoA dioxygenase family)
MKTINVSEAAQQFERDGYVVVRGFLSPTEATELRERFMEIQREALDKESPTRKSYQPASVEESGGDVLKQFPRVMHPHRFDEQSKQMMLDERIESVLRALFGEEPLAAQSMFYFKPPGARGQALHQDNFYLKVSPGTCIAAWASLDDADAENGTLFVVPGSHREKVLCPHAADLSKSFTTEEVDIPEGLEAVEVKLSAGDVLFFNGSLIHGSYPNISTDRFRRSFICHYVGAGTTEMNSGYYPLHSFDGLTLTKGEADGGGPCGTEEWAAFKEGLLKQEMHDEKSLDWLLASARA